MKTEFDLNEIEVAIRDIEYLKELNATEEEIEITKQVLNNNYSESSNFVFKSLKFLPNFAK